MKHTITKLIAGVSVAVALAASPAFAQDGGTEHVRRLLLE